MAGSPILVEFDGPNRRITVKAGVTNIDVQSDLYSDWKEWAQEGDNAKYPPAFRTVGGDPTNPSATQFTPRYFFLQDQYGWEILIDGETVVVQLNLLAESGLSPFRVVNNGAVTNRTSDAQVIQSEIEETLAYQDRVYIDTGSSYSGTAYPVGTAAQPVNNLTDALAIAALIGSSTIFMRSNVTSDQSHTGIRFIGEDGSKVFDANGFSADGCTFERCTITGDLNDSGITAIQCFVSVAQNFYGLLYDSLLTGLIKITSGQKLLVDDCGSAVGHNPGLTPEFDMNIAGSTELVITGWSGHFHLSNMTQAQDDVVVDMISGYARFLPSCVSGAIVLRGVGRLVDESVSGSPQLAIDLRGFVDGEEARTSHKILRNKMVTDPTTGKQVLYDDDGATILIQADLYEDKDGTTPYRGQGADRRERLE